jgi:hypothetical protein
MANSCINRSFCAIVAVKNVEQLHTAGFDGNVGDFACIRRANRRQRIFAGRKN